MKFLKYIFIVVLLFTSCKTKKIAMSTNAIAKEMSARKVAKKHIAASLEKETINAKLKASFNNGKTKQSISVYLKMRKDEVIWLKGTKFITVFKAMITPNSVRYYSPYAKNYFEGDFSMLKKILGTDINFQQLQNLLLGQSILNVKKEKQNIEIVGNSYVLSPKEQANLYDAFFAINPGHFKLDKQTIVSSLKAKELNIAYPSYSLVDDAIFPKEINIKAKDGKKVTTIDFTVKSVEFNTELNTSFSIPKGYKQIKL